MNSKMLAGKFYSSFGALRRPSEAPCSGADSLVRLTTDSVAARVRSKAARETKFAAVQFLMFLTLLNVSPAHAEGEKVMEKNIYSFTMKTIEGEEKSLADYKGKALLVVNTASKCGFTPQYAGLEKLYEKYKDKGFEILAFPANNFLGQEPGTNSEIKEFCSLKFKTTFQLFSKISVKGKDIDPLYAYLTKESGFNGDIKWNFNKFLIAPDGRVIARFDSNVDPMSDKITGPLEANLPRASTIR